MKMMLAFAAVTGLIGGAVAMEAVQGAPAFIRTVDSGDEATLAPRRIVIGLDLSKSNPLIDNPAFAAKVAQRIAGEVRRLGFASEVHVRTFGNFDASSNTFAYDMIISTRARPRERRRRDREAHLRHPDAGGARQMGG